MKYRRRKSMRLQGYDYGSPGRYFITICTVEREQCLSSIVGADVLIGPDSRLTRYGNVVRDTFEELEAVEAYAIMPDHVHFLIHFPQTGNGPLGTAAPTAQKNEEAPQRTNRTVDGIVRLFKRRITQRCGKSMWQRGYYDHIIRDEKDYLRILNYIGTNPAGELERRDDMKR